MKNHITNAVAIIGLAAPLGGLAQTATLLTTFTNSMPRTNDQFARSLAAVGNDRVLIGANLRDSRGHDDGAAYLFSTNGVLLSTFTNPPADYGGRFGYSVAAVGSDRVLIGAITAVAGPFYSGVAYLFSTEGTLLTRIANPTPADFDDFGSSVAAVGSDGLIVGALGDNTGAHRAGAAYLFNTNGVLLTTFTNPTPASDQVFGASVAGVGSDRVLVGAISENLLTNGAGAAYLFSTNGALLTTFTNPTPEPGDGFGRSVAAFGNDRVLIGADWDRTGAYAAGAAYLFGTNGNLLMTFTNPAPVTNDYFGRSVAALGADRVLIGAYQHDTGAVNAGTAFVFSTNGTLLMTITNPTPAAGDGFGIAVAAMGADRVVIGAAWNDTGAQDAGAAFLFSVPPAPAVPPSLNIRRTATNTLAISWPWPSTGFALQGNDSLAPTGWTDLPGPIENDGTTSTFIVRPTSSGHFYRLLKP